MTEALISLGSNLGDRAATLAGAVRALDGRHGIQFMAVSSLHETAPSGGPADQPVYLNAAARLRFGGDPLRLLRTLQRVEANAGRVREVRWGARTLDLDLLMVGSVIRPDPVLTLPHPLMAVRRFVLAPLAEVAAGAVHPLTGRTVADLLQNLDRRPTRLELLDPDPARRQAIRAALGKAFGVGVELVEPGESPTLRVEVGGPGPGFDPVPTIRAEPTDPATLARWVVAVLVGSGHNDVGWTNLPCP